MLSTDEIRLQGAWDDEMALRASHGLHNGLGILIFSTYINVNNKNLKRWTSRQGRCINRAIQGGAHAARIRPTSYT